MKNFRFALMMLIALATFAAPGLAQVTIGVKVDGVVRKTNPPATIVTTSEIAAQVYEPKWTTDGEYYFYYEVRGITATYSELLGTPPVSVVHDTHTLPDFTQHASALSDRSTSDSIRTTRSLRRRYR